MPSGERYGAVDPPTTHAVRSVYPAMMLLLRKGGTAVGERLDKINRLCAVPRPGTNRETSGSPWRAAGGAS